MDALSRHNQAPREIKLIPRGHVPSPGRNALTLDGPRASVYHMKVGHPGDVDKPPRVSIEQLVPPKTRHVGIALPRRGEDATKCVWYSTAKNPSRKRTS